MIYFLTIYSAVAALSLTDFIPKWRKWGAFLCILLLSMLAGWRTMGGKDFFIYQDIYYGLGLNYFSSEMGYAFINNIFSAIGFSFNGFLFFYSLVSIALLVLFLEKHSLYPKFSLLIYMGCYFFFYNMVLNRQMFCMSLALWIIYWWDKNKLYALLCLFIGMSFHQSLFALLPFLLAYEGLRHTKGKICWVTFFILFGVGCIFISPMQAVSWLGTIPGISFVPARVLGYLEKSNASYTLDTTEYIKLLVVLPVLFFFFKKIIREQTMRIWLFMYFCGVIFLLWTRNVEILFRVFAYLDLSLLVLIPFCIKSLSSSFLPKQRNIFLLGIYILTGLLAIGAILYRTAHFGNGVFWSYQFYFLI